ncbi:MAG: hypothetical protein ACI89L_002714 [Phycisphaerales bacterium]|jgi:hypothetical protein
MLRSTFAVPLALALLMPSGSALAQPEDELPQDSPFLSFERPQRWTFGLRATLLAGESASNVATARRSGGRSVANRTLSLDEWRFEQFVVVAPVVLRTASSLALMSKPTGSLELDDFIVDEEPTIPPPYQGQALYARWDLATAGVAREMELEQWIDYISYETVFDEDAAMQIGWPTRWPGEAQSTFLPQQYVSLDAAGSPFPASDTTVADLLAKWTGGEDPKAIPPVQLAKWLAGKVQEYVRISRAGTTNRRQQDAEMATASPTASGIEVKSAPETALIGEGTKHDAAVLLAALYREAGLPTRLVMGYQENERDGSRKLRDQERIRSWVEFALYDEASDQLTWVPVDVARLRESSSRMKPMDQKWKYFGSHDELDDVVPIAFHIHPPTDVRSYASAAFFGITMVPAPPDRATQFITFSQNRTPTRPPEQD